jgi:hypothetical protein
MNPRQLLQYDIFRIQSVGQEPGESLHSDFLLKKGIKRGYLQRQPLFMP